MRFCASGKHALADLIPSRIFTIRCRDEDADDLNCLRPDPAFKLACGRLPDTGDDLGSQLTLSRLEHYLAAVFGVIFRATRGAAQVSAHLIANCGVGWYFMAVDTARRA